MAKLSTSPSTGDRSGASVHKFAVEPVHKFTVEPTVEPKLDLNIDAAGEERPTDRYDPSMLVFLIAITAGAIFIGFIV